MAKNKKKILLIVVSVFLIMALLFASFVVYAEAVRKQSYQSLAVASIFKIIMLSKQGSTQESALKNLESRRIKNQDYKVHQKYVRKYDMEIYDSEGFEVCVINKSSQSGKYIFYLHGGAFVEQPLSFHYSFLKKLAKETDVTVIMPVYPKAPNYTYETSIDMVVKTYKGLLENVNSEDITIMGDSAGGSMSLSVCQHFNKIGLPQPSNIIMFSPCLDCTLSNPEINDYIKKDLLLSLTLLKVKVDAYAGSEDALKNYLVSPIYGDLENLAPMTLFVGGNEIFVPDSRIFVKMAEEKGIIVDYYEYDNMLHAFPVYPIPEAKEVREIINKKING